MSFTGSYTEAEPELRRLQKSLKNVYGTLLDETKIMYSMYNFNGYQTIDTVMKTEFKLEYQQFSVRTYEFELDSSAMFRDESATRRNVMFLRTY